MGTSDKVNDCGGTPAFCGFRQCRIMGACRVYDLNARQPSPPEVPPEDRPRPLPAFTKGDFVTRIHGGGLYEVVDIDYKWPRPPGMPEYTIYVRQHIGSLSAPTRLEPEMFAALYFSRYTPAGMKADLEHIVQEATSPQLEAASPPAKDAVILPEHYARFKFEPIRFLVENYGAPIIIANILKYIMRYDAKNGLEDIRKAKRYIRMLERYEMKDPDWWQAERDGDRG